MFIAINLKSSNFHQKNLEKTDIRKITVLWQFYEIKLAIKENYSVKRQGWGGEDGSRGNLDNHRNAVIVKIIFAN